jgi:hypothetical protein
MAGTIKEKDPIKKATKPKKTATAEKATAKPRKVTAKKAKAVDATVVAEPARFVMPSREEIARLARQYWAQRGYQDGYAEQDWLQAEQELLKKAS